MLANRSDDLAVLASEVDRQRREVAELFGGLEHNQRVWRPDGRRWSVTGHLAHLGIVNEAYVRAIGDAVTEARARGAQLGEGPYRHPRVTVWFARSMEPPPKRRLKTFRSMVPDPGTDAEEAMATFDRLQVELAERIGQAAGLDLGRIRFGSPFMALLRFSLGTALATVLAHNRRHIWLMHETVETASFPRGS